MPLSGETVRSLFFYDFSTGALHWIDRPHARSAKRAGDIAGGKKPNGRWCITIEGVSYQRSNLVWIFHHDFLPDAEIDHENRVADDDRIENLREATRSQQLVNRGVMGHNTSGFRSVYFDPRKKRWAARVSIFGKRKRLGSYDTAEEAAAVADRAGREAYGEFWHSSC